MNNLLITGWLNQNTFIYLLVPFVLLFPVIVLAYLKICSTIAKHITNKLFRFNVAGVIGLILAAILAASYASIFSGIKSDWEIFKLPEYLGASTVVFLLFGLPALNVFRLIEILIDKKIQNRPIQLVLNFLSTSIIPFLAFFSMYQYLWREHFGITEILQLSYLFVGGLIVASFRLLISYNIQNEKELIRTNEIKLAALRELKTRAELNALHSQINPHFLYNALNSIAGLAHENANKTEFMAVALSKLFRYSINKEKSDWTTLKEELEMVQIYLEIEKIRFDEQLTYSVEIQDAMQECRIPRFIIQPLVENAVKHGLSKTVEPFEIRIVIISENNWLTIGIYDSGPAFPEDLIPGFGLQGIYDKLEILYPERFEMNYSNSPLKNVTIRLK